MGCGHRYRPPSKVREPSAVLEVIARLTTTAHTNPGVATVLARPEHGTAPGRQSVGVVRFNVVARPRTAHMATVTEIIWMGLTGLSSRVGTLEIWTIMS